MTATASSEQAVTPPEAGDQDEPDALDPADAALDQAVTPPEAGDQDEPDALDPADAALDQAVTEALARLARWSQGHPSREAMRATVWAVVYFDLKILTDRAYRLRFADAEGHVVSMARVLAFGRKFRVLNVNRCGGCGEPIPLSAYRRQQRGARIDRHYCSNACRQRAYRSRTTTKENP